MNELKYEKDDYVQVTDAVTLKEKDFNIDIFTDRNCNVCFGSGYVARNLITGKLLVCSKCVRKNYIKHIAEERSKEYALLQGQSL